MKNGKLTGAINLQDLPWGLSSNPVPDASPALVMRWRRRFPSARKLGRPVMIILRQSSANHLAGASVDSRKLRQRQKAFRRRRG